MRITARQLRKLINEAAISALDEDNDIDLYDDLDDEDDDSEFFLHGYEDGEPFDAEGDMAKFQLHRIKEISYMLCDMLEADDQLPSWVQAHITTAYENLNQVLSYMEPKFHMSHSDDEEDEESDGEFDEVDLKEGKKGLWDRIRDRRKAKKPKLKPGQKGYPKTLDIAKKK